MDEEKKLTEQELDQVAGGAGGYDAKFEQEWARYEQHHCVRCYWSPRCSTRPDWHDANKRDAAEKWRPGSGIECKLFSLRP